MLAFTNPFSLAGLKEDVTSTESSLKRAIGVEPETLDATSHEFLAVFSEVKIQLGKSNSAPASFLISEEYLPINTLPSVVTDEPERVIFQNIESLKNKSAAELSQLSLPADLPPPMAQVTPNQSTTTGPLKPNRLPDDTFPENSNLVASERANSPSSTDATLITSHRAEIRLSQAPKTVSPIPNTEKVRSLDKPKLVPTNPDHPPAKSTRLATMETAAPPSQVPQTRPEDPIATHSKAKVEVTITSQVQETAQEQQGVLKLPRPQILDSSQKTAATYSETAAKEGAGVTNGRDTARAPVDSGEKNAQQPLGKPLSISTVVSSASPRPKISEHPVRSLDPKAHVDSRALQVPDNPSIQQVIAPTHLPIGDEIKHPMPLPISSEPKLSLDPITSAQTSNPAPQTIASTIQPPVIAQSLQEAIQIQIREAVQSSASNDIEIRLEPEELGKLRILMSPRESGMHVMILADRPETLELMRRNSEDLAGYLAEGGHENANIDFSSYSENEHDEGAKPSTQSTEFHNDPDHAHIVHGLDDASIDIRL